MSRLIFAFLQILILKTQKTLANLRLWCIIVIRKGVESVTTGERIKARRKELGLSAEQLAAKIGVSAATVYRYENGSIEKVSSDILAPLAQALHTTTYYLMGWDMDEYLQRLDEGIVEVEKQALFKYFETLGCAITQLEKDKYRVFIGEGYTKDGEPYGYEYMVTNDVIEKLKSNIWSYTKFILKELLKEEGVKKVWPPED